MADTNAQDKLKAYLRESGEKAAIGAATGLLLLYALYAFVIKGDDLQLQDARDKRDQLQTQLSTAHELPPDRLKVDVNVAEVWQQPRSVPPVATPKHDWAISLLPKINAVADEAITIEVVREYAITPVKAFTAWVQVTSVTLRWTLGTPPPGKDEALIDKFILERKAGKGAWAVLTEVPPLTTSYIDTTIDPVTAYSYRLTPVTANVKVIDKKGTPTNPVEVVTPDIYRFTFSNPSTQPPSIWITIEKFDKEQGLVSFGQTYKPVHQPVQFDVLGANQQLAPSDKSRFLQPDKRSGKIVEFNPGLILKAIEETAEVALQANVCPGGATCPGPSKVESRAKRNKIVLEDSKGVKHDYYYPPPEDKLCANHAPADPGKPQDGDKPPPFAPPAMTEDQKKALKEAEDKKDKEAIARLKEEYETAVKEARAKYDADLKTAAEEKARKLQENKEAEQKAAATWAEAKKKHDADNLVEAVPLFNQLLTDSGTTNFVVTWKELITRLSKAGVKEE